MWKKYVRTWNISIFMSDLRTSTIWLVQLVNGGKIQKKIILIMKPLTFSDYTQVARKDIWYWIL